MSAISCEWLDGLLNGDYNFTVYSRKNARAELAALRADLQAAQERIAQLEAALAFSDAEKDRRIAEMARQLDAAREIFENIFKRDWTNAKINDKARAWLAANPAPEPQP